MISYILQIASAIDGGNSGAFGTGNVYQTDLNATDENIAHKERMKQNGLRGVSP